MSDLHEMCASTPGARDSRPTALTVAVTGGTGTASLAKLEAAHGPLAGEYLGDPFTICHAFGSDGSRMLHFAPEGVASFTGRRELAPGLSAQVGPVDLSEADAEGPGASLWLAMQSRPGMRAQGLPEAPKAWLAMLNEALGGRRS